MTGKDLGRFRKVFDREIIQKNLIALKYELRERLFRAQRIDMPDPIFIVGCSRSGTTVTFDTIRNSCQLIAFPNEIPQFWHSLFGPWDNNWVSECADTQNANPEHRAKTLAHFYARLGKGQVMDKSCINILRIPYLHALFPDAKFIYIHRDGRDNVSSLMDGWRHNRHFNLAPLLGAIPGPVSINEGEFDDWCFFLPSQWQQYNSAPLEEVCAHQWITANARALEAKQLVPEDKWIQFPYENIVDSPVDTFNEIFDRLGLEFTPAIRSHCATLNQRPTSIVAGPPARDKWRLHHPNEIERVLPKLEPMMKQLGYSM